ncbi:hypothetical protein SAMN05421803_11229 [Nocardiopsis flavescens]|uniref:Uncharacterized protein n=1 Tax=Nocardiopsis flavescens TaxID=758803 RepID=A0A1M6NNQ5_9ACTN|nr:hypothetical protein [Nocardiopsis flavescens]SHJ97371.1 hypothetical protein SAMN05421803_11229 [Nocardiopsis flavescens]
MSSPTEIATLAASAVVGAMANGTWSYLRGRCTELLEKHIPDGVESLLGRFDSYEETLEDTEPENRQVVTSTLTRVAARDLADVAGRSPDAAEDIRALADAAASVSGGEIVNIGTTFKNIEVGGDFNVSGRDNNITKGA